MKALDSGSSEVRSSCSVAGPLGFVEVVDRLGAGGQHRVDRGPDA